MLGIGLGLMQCAINNRTPAVLGTLGVNPPTITENSAPGAIVGAITGGKPGSTITITGTAGSRFAISGGNVVAGATNTDYETATSYDITLRETNAAYPNSPKDTVITIAVADVNTLLSPLTLSASSLQENSAAGTVVGTIQNTSGGTVTITDTAGGRFALGTGGDAGKVVAGATNTDYETATTHNITLTETLGESSNSPRNTVLAIAVTDVAVEGTTWSTTDKNAGVTVSGGDLTATAASGGLKGVRGTTAKTGARYFEVTYGAVNANYPAVGIANASETLSGNIGLAGNGAAIYADGLFYPGGVDLGRTFAPGDVVGVLVTAGSTIEFRKNGGSFTTPQSIAGISGAIKPIAGFATSGDAVTANFGASAFGTALPGASSAWNA